MTHVQRLLQVLCAFYTSQGKPHVMNDLQAEVYISALARFTPEDLEAAGKRHMLTSKFFPALSELLELLKPQVDTAALSQMAWLSVERAIRAAGVYRGAHFEQGVVGEAVRQVFGTWATACQFDVDSPGWAIRRQSFLTIFPSLLGRQFEPVTLLGQHRDREPYQVPPIAALEAVRPLLSSATRPELPATHSEAVEALKRVGMLKGVK